MPHLALQSTLIKKNDFVINSRSDRRGSCGISEFDGSCSLINTVLKPRRNMCNEYYSFVFRSERFADEFYKWGTGIVDDLWSTKWSRMKNIYIPAPSLETQQRIADYLDDKCGKIDEVIAKEGELIEKLKAYKLSLITETVTKGLDPKAEMKDSGIEWIGKIPKGWVMRKLKFCSYIRARLGWKGLKAEEYVDTGYPLLSAFNIIDNKMSFEKLNYINQERYDESPEIKLACNDILLVKDGAGIGKCAIIRELVVPSTVNGSLAVITTSGLNAVFLYYFFLCNVFQTFINQLKDGMGVPHLFQRDLKEISVPTPSLDEQERIADYLDSKCALIDETIAKKQVMIEKLAAYKKSLIYEVVTGKIEV